MKVFLSWSGDLSRQFAQAFRDWLPSVLQTVQPYYSNDDIVRGGRWFEDIYSNLKECKYCLLFITPENVDSVWMNFEAGAAATSFEKSRISPLLFRLEPAALKGPLANFQASPFSKSEVLKVVLQINSDNEDQKLSEVIVEKVYEKWWPDLEATISTILSSAPLAKGSNKGSRTQQDMVEEVLLRIRDMQEALTNPSRGGDDLVQTIFPPIQHLTTEIVEFVPTSWSDYVRLLEVVQGPLLYILGKNLDGPLEGRGSRLVSMFRRRLREATAKKQIEDEIPF